MPPRDPRLCPALEYAHPADSDETSGYRSVREPREVLFGDGEWHLVDVRATWLDRHGRVVVQVQWHIRGETWGEAYLLDRDKVREAAEG